MKAKLFGRLWKQSSSSIRQQCKWNWWNDFYIVGYHSIMWNQAYLANSKWDMSWWFWIDLNDSGLALIKGWRMDQECINEEIPIKG
jgi:hypothetical protein